MIIDQFLALARACYAVPMVRGSPNPKHFGLPARMRKARKLSGLTRMALAQKAGGGQTVSLDVEAGARLPTVFTLARLASALGVSAPWLAYGLGDMSADGSVADTDGMGARLQAARVEQGHSKASLGRAAGLSPPSIAGIENGGQAGVETIEALAKALNVSPAWLAYGVGPQRLPSRRSSRIAAPSA